MLDLEYRDHGNGTFEIQYDSRDRSAALQGAYTRAADVQLGGSDTWRTATIALPRARLANRQNGLCDLRLCVRGPELTVRALRIRRRP